MAVNERDREVAETIRMTTRYSAGDERLAAYREEIEGRYAPIVEALEMIARQNVSDTKAYEAFASYAQDVARAALSKIGQ